MTTKTNQEIVVEIDLHMSNSGVRNSGWYVGIASDVKQRLFGDHNVSEKGGTWIYRKTASSDDARHLESLYHRAGCKGGPGGGDHTTVFLYAYVITGQSAE